MHKTKNKWEDVKSRLMEEPNGGRLKVKKFDDA